MKSFIIHLSKIAPSLETALNLKEQLEKFNMPVELFEGTYGVDAAQQMLSEGRALHHEGIKGTFDLSNPALEKMQTPGIKGCFYSHYRLWKKCVELNEPILIFEDDIVLSRPYTPIEWKDVLIVALGHPKKSPNWMKYLENPDGKPAAIEYTHSSMPGCCGYAIKPHAAKKLLETYNNTFLPADNAINAKVVTIELHNYIMGIALTKLNGKSSLTRTKFWNTYKDNQ